MQNYRWPHIFRAVFVALLLRFSAVQIIAFAMFLRACVCSFIAAFRDGIINHRQYPIIFGVLVYLTTEVITYLDLIVCFVRMTNPVNFNYLPPPHQLSTPS